MKKNRQIGTCAHGVMQSVLVVSFIIAIVTLANVSQAAEAVDSAAANYTTVSPKKAGKFPLERSVTDVTPQLLPLGAIEEMGKEKAKPAAYYTITSPKKAGKFIMGR